jgi:hypothetical protein
MVNMKDIEKLVEDFMLELDAKFSELKPYLLSEFEWNVDPAKQSYFLIRGRPIPEDKTIGDILKSHMSNETIVLKEMK